MTKPVDQLVCLVDEAFDHRSWHGPTLRGALRGVSARQAAWRPARGRHNIWELAVHAAYWKYAVRRMLRGDRRGSFPVKGSNWFTRPESGLTARPLEAAWRSDLRLLGDEHRQLRAAVADLTTADLDRRPRGSGSTIGFLVRGIAAHDLYHAGQVQVIKRLQGR